MIGSIILWGLACVGTLALMVLATPKVMRVFFGRRTQYLIVDGYEVIVAYREVEEVEWALKHHWDASAEDLETLQSGDWVRSENSPANQQVYLERLELTVYRFEEPL